MDGSKIESHLCSAAARALYASAEISRLVNFCSAGMKTSEETDMFLFDVIVQRQRLEYALDELRSIEKMYRDVRRVGGGR